MPRLDVSTAVPAADVMVDYSRQTGVGNSVAGRVNREPNLVVGTYGGYELASPVARRTAISDYEKRDYRRQAVSYVTEIAKSGVEIEDIMGLAHDFARFIMYGKVPSADNDTVS